MTSLEPEHQSAGFSADPMVPAMLRVIRKRHQTGDTFDLLLDTTPRGGLSFLPGQFNMLYVFGVGEAPISVSSDPASTNRLVHTIRSVGTVTRALSRLKRGELLGLRGPFGTAWPLEEARGKDVLVIAGGIGLAPLKPVVHALLRQRTAYRRLFIAYGARTPTDILFRRELGAWRRHLDVTVELIVDRGDAEWRGHTGVVTKLLELASFDAKNALAMVCGPEVMMRFCALDLVGLGIPMSRIFLSAERNMKCAIGFCGHCQLSQHFVCKDGPVFSYEKLAALLPVREV